MSKNFIERVLTSIILLSLFLIINYSHKYIFILSILIVGMLICVEFNNILSKLSINNILDKNLDVKRFNIKFLFLNTVTFFYIFFIFCNISYKIYALDGPTFFLYILSICFFTDIGGYLFGKIIGGKKLTKISPKKTLSGSIGSFILSVSPLFFFSNLGYLDLEFNFKNILFCLLVSFVSQLGDLFISFLKRKAKIKDTGKILPGHGGLLDRVDGIIFAVPISFFLLRLI